MQGSLLADESGSAGFIQEMIMTIYLKIYLAVIAISFLVVWASRLVSKSKTTQRKVVSLSHNGQWKFERQQGFVRPDRRASRSSVGVPRGPSIIEKMSNRKPWGW